MHRLTPPSVAKRAAPGVRFYSAIAVLAATALIVSCGGESDNPAATSTTAATATTAALEATATVPAAQTRAPEPPSTALTDLASFRFEVTVTGAGTLLGLGVPGTAGENLGDAPVTARGAWIAPDRAQLEIEVGESRFKQTVIGEQEWLSVSGVSQGPSPATTAARDLLVVESILGPEPPGLEGFDCDHPEQVNGVETVRCEATDSVEQQVMDGFGQGDVEAVDDAGIVMWIAREGGYVVKMEMGASGKLSGGDAFAYDMRLNITDIGNVPDIQP